LSHTKGVTGVAIGGDGKLATAATWDRSLRVWSLDKSQPALKTESRPFEGHTGDILALALSAGGQRALTGGTDGTLRLWDAVSGKELLRLQGHELGVQALAFSEGNTAYSFGLDKTLRQWDLAKGTAARRSDLPPTAFLTAFSPDGKMLALCLKEGGVQLVDAAGGKKVRDLENGPKFVQSLAFSEDGRLLAAASSAGGNITTVWDVASGKAKTLEKEFGHQFPVSTLTFSRDGRFLASGSSDRTVCIWDVQAGREVRRVGYFPLPVLGIVFAPDGKTIFVSSGSPSRGPTDPTNGSIAQMDVSSGKMLQYWDELPGVPLRSLFLSDGRQMLTVLGSSLKRWTPEGGRTVAQK
jgi:WD40 repeat protein